MEHIGKIKTEYVSEYKNKIITNEVVLTSERLNDHILIKHKKEYENLRVYLKEIVEEPDYILRDNRHSDTLIFLKYVNIANKRGRIVIKLAIAADERHPKNSIITLMQLNERTWNQTIKNKGEIIFDKFK